MAQKDWFVGEEADELTVNQQQVADVFHMDNNAYDDHGFLHHTHPTCVNCEHDHLSVNDTVVDSPSQDNSWKLEAVKGYLANQNNQISGGSAWWKNINADISSDLMTTHIDFV